MKPNPFFFVLCRIFIFTCTRVNRETTTKRNTQYIIHNVSSHFHESFQKERSIFLFPSPQRADLRTNQTRERDPHILPFVSLFPDERDRDPRRRGIPTAPGIAAVPVTILLRASTTAGLRCCSIDLQYLPAVESSHHHHLPETQRNYSHPMGAHHQV